MRRLLLATMAGAALLGATAASAQTFYSDGYAYGYDGYAYRRPFVERGVGLQVGPVGVGVFADRPVYGDRYYRTRASHWGWSESPPSIGGN